MYLETMKYHQIGIVKIEGNVSLMSITIAMFFNSYRLQIKVVVYLKSISVKNICQNV